MIKGFGETTLLKLKENGITNLKELHDAMEGKTAGTFQTVLTPIQFKQAQNYFIENPYKII